MTPSLHRILKIPGNFSTQSRSQPTKNNRQRVEGVTLPTVWMKRIEDLIPVSAKIQDPRSIPLPLPKKEGGNTDIRRENATSFFGVRPGEGPLFWRTPVVENGVSDSFPPK